MSRQQVEAFLTGIPEVHKEPMPTPSVVERHAEFKAERNRLVHEARAGMRLAYSYRGFHVGCSVLAWHPTKGWVSEYSGNFKPKKKVQTGKELRCAERNALDAALNDECVKIAAIVTACEKGDANDLSKEGVLLPCAECQKYFRELFADGLIDEDTILYSLRDYPLPKKGHDVMIDIDGTVKPIPSGAIEIPGYRRADVDFEVMGKEQTMGEFLKM